MAPICGGYSQYSMTLGIPILGMEPVSYRSKPVQPFEFPYFTRLSGREASSGSLHGTVLVDVPAHPPAIRLAREGVPITEYLMNDFFHVTRYKCLLI